MEPTRYPRVFIVAAFLIALAAGAYIALHLYDPVVIPVLDVLPPFAIAFVFAFLLDPIVDWMQKRGFSRGFGVAIVGLAFVVVFVLVGFLLVPNVADQAGKLADNLPRYIREASDAVNNILVRYKPLLERSHLPTTASEWASRFSAQIQRAATSGLSLVAGLLTASLSKLLWVIIIPLATLWFLNDLDYIKNKVIHFTPDRHKERLMHLSSAIAAVFGKYVRGMLVVAIIHSAVATLWMSLAGLDYALIIGGLSGLLYVVPYVGTLMIVVATGIAAAVQPGHGLVYALALMAGAGLQSSLVFDCLITPKVVGGSVGVHPVLALFSLALGARLFGIVGMVLAYPVVAALQVALGQYYPQIHDDLRPQNAPRESRHPERASRHSERSEESRSGRRKKRR